MTCNLERPDPQELFNRYLQMFSTTVLGGAAVVPESNEWYAASVNYAMAEEFYAISEQAWKERDPRQACCENLVKMAERDGVFPRPSTFAQGYIKVFGDAGTTLPVPLQFTVGGASFITASNSSQPTIIAFNGEAVIRVRALIAGALNLTDLGATLNTRVDGVNSYAELCGNFCEGAAAESCEAFRSRYLRRLQYQPRSTNQWILDKLLEWPCATRAIQRAGSCCQCGSRSETGTDCEDCGCKDCGGDIAFYLLFDTSFPNGLAPDNVIEEADEWLFGNPKGYGLGQVEIGVCGRLVPIKPFEVVVILDIAACVTTAQISQIETQITEFFSTLEPSQPLRARAVDTIVANIVGADMNFEVRFDFLDPAVAYGGSFGPRQDSSLVYVGGCDLEPDCDAMPVFGGTTINRPNASGGNC